MERQSESDYKLLVSKCLLSVLVGRELISTSEAERALDVIKRDMRSYEVSEAA